MARADVSWVSASEVAEAAYCVRAYRLQRVERVALNDAARERLAHGTRQHAAHGTRYARQRGLHVAALWLGAAALVLALIAALVRA